jgi:ankyrin repeat protein
VVPLRRAFHILLEGKDPGYINFQNCKGATALNIASHRGHVEYVRLLLEKAKADVNIPNTSGSTSLIQASHFGHSDVVALLLGHGAMVDRPNHKGAVSWRQRSPARCAFG